MKRFFHMSVLVLMTALTLASCGGGDDKQKDEPTPTPTPTSKTVTYEATANFSQDVIDICDVTMSYKDGDGKTVTEAVKSTTWSKTVSVKNLPTTVGVKFGIKMKSGVNLTKEKYDLIMTVVHDVIVDGKSKGNTSPKVVIQGYGARPANVASILSSKDGTIFGYDISSSGAAVETKNVSF